MKQIIWAIVAAGLLVAGSMVPAEAANGRSGGSQGGSGWRAGVPQGGARFHGGSAKWAGGGYYGGRGWYGGKGWYGGNRVFIGGGFGWWGWPGWSGPGWWGAPYPYYSSPPVVVQPGPTEYIQQAPAPPAYWYYCQSAGAYYPYVKDCPGGWMQVVPQPAPPGQ